MPNVGGFLLTSVFNSKTTEVKNKIPDITNLVTKSALTVVENKRPDVASFVKKNRLCCRNYKKKK